MELVKDVERKRRLERARFASQLYFIELANPPRGRSNDDELLHRTTLACARKLLTPKQWNEIAVERSAENRCGWPMCDEGLPKHPPLSAMVETKALVRIEDAAVIASRSLGKISGSVHAVDLFEYTNYCSDKCYVLSVAWMLKLSEDNIMTRQVELGSFARVEQFLDNTGVPTPYDKLPEVAMKYLLEQEEKFKANHQPIPADATSDPSKVAKNQVISKDILEKRVPNVNGLAAKAKGTFKRRQPPSTGTGKVAAFTYDDDDIEEVMFGSMKEKMTDSSCIKESVVATMDSIEEDNGDGDTPSDIQNLEVAHINEWYDQDFLEGVDGDQIDEEISSDEAFVEDYEQPPVCSQPSMYRQDDQEGESTTNCTTNTTTSTTIDQLGGQIRGVKKNYWEALMEKYSSVLSDSQ